LRRPVICRDRNSSTCACRHDYARQPRTEPSGHRQDHDVPRMRPSAAIWEWDCE